MISVWIYTIKHSIDRMNNYKQSFGIQICDFIREREREREREKSKCKCINILVGVSQWQVHTNIHYWT